MIYKSRITLNTSLRLARPDMCANLFDYIFIDEISCAIEPEALVPIIDFGTSEKTITSSMIFLGDHKQLGPVSTSEEFSDALGLDVSLMERMMSCSKYLKDPQFDDLYVVQLLDNYRSHPAILKFSSDQFYEGILRPKMSLIDQRMTFFLTGLFDYFPRRSHSIWFKWHKFVQ